ncbi:MAG: aquaporin Z [Kofleriaceae bacterium]
MKRKLAAEAIGTFWLVFGGCGTAIFGGGAAGIGLHAIAMAFGLTVLTMAYTVGHISGGHFNPAVTLGLVAAGKHPAHEAGPYIGAQLAGALLAAGVIAIILKSGDAPLGSFAANGWRSGTLGSAAITEIVTTFGFLLVIIGSTSKRAPAGFAPIAIGLCLALIHMISIPITNTSVNPARSTSQAIFAGGDFLSQLWLFWVAPIAGAVLAGATSKWLQQDE